MALKGQGDPRWIVEAREDGRNVNNWHWTETDFTSWAKNKLTELLENLTIETNDFTCKLSTVTMTGDVSVNTRKQKTILFYELDVTVKWEGTLNKSGLSAKGSVMMPYISEENDDDDFEVKVSVEGDSRDHDTLKDALRKEIIPILKKKVPQMLQELRDVALNKTKLPTKAAPTTKIEAIETKVEPQPPVATPKPTAPPTASKPSAPRLVNVELTEKFLCRPMDLFQCFIEPNRVKAYAGGDAQVNGVVSNK